MVFIKEYKNILILSGIVVVVTAGLLIFIILPAYATISESTEAVHDDRVQLSILEQERINIEETQREYTSIQEDIQLLDQVFVEGDVLQVISALERIAEENSITQELSLVGEPSSSTINMKLAFTCPWSRCVEYLSLLEQLDIYLSLSDPSISRSGDQVAFSFNVTAYVKQ